MPEHLRFGGQTHEDEFAFFIVYLGIIFIKRNVEEDEGRIRNYLNKATEINTWLPKQQGKRAERRLNTTKFERNFPVHPLAPRSVLAAAASGRRRVRDPRGAQGEGREGKGRQGAKGRQGRGGHCPCPPPGARQVTDAGPARALLPRDALVLPGTRAAQLLRSSLSSGRG